MKPNFPPTGTKIETRRKTYIRGLILLMPAALFSEFISSKCFPVYEHIRSDVGRPDNARIEGIWQALSFLVNNRFIILSVTILILVLLELFSSGWTRYRRNVIGGVVWVLNLIVIGTLSTLILYSCIFIPWIAWKYEAELSKRNGPAVSATAEPSAAR